MSKKRQLELTGWVHSWTETRGGREVEKAQMTSSEIPPSWAGWGGAEIHSERVDWTVKVGDDVEVDAFGRWRAGEVLGFGRTKVRVRFVRNLSGDLDERSFGVGELRPAGSDVPGRWRK